MKPTLLIPLLLSCTSAARAELRLPALFSNQMAFLGPKRDPAKIRGLEDAGEAFRRIAKARAPFVLNDIDGIRYLTEILWNAAGCPDRTGWFIDE